MTGILAALLLTEQVTAGMLPVQPQDDLIESAQDERPFEQGDATTFLDGSRRIRNLSYADGENRDWYRHLLDIYLPPEEKWAAGRPMIMWIHGGGWQIGYKDDLFGLYGYIARQFAARGIAFANINYRLSPRVTHPGHVQDCAAAFFWLNKHAGDFGYDPEHMFVSGHSAGGHLAALLCTDPRWLAAYGLHPGDDVAGCIPSSGVYDIARLRNSIALDGDDGDARGGGIARVRIGRGWVNPFKEEDLKSASPIVNVSRDDPPFLVIYEGTSIRNYMEHEALAFSHVLESYGVDHETVEVPDENHVSMLIDMLRPGNVAVQRMLAFITRCTASDSQGDDNR